MSKFGQTTSESSELERYLEFSLGGEGFAIPLLQVRELISVPETTPIPYSPAHFLGIMNLRGQVISVVDLRKKMKLAENEDHAENAVIIIEIAGVNMGVVVDSINKVLAFPRSDIAQVPEIGTQVNSEYIDGIFKNGDELVVLLDLAKVLSLTDLKFAKQQVQEAA